MRLALLCLVQVAALCAAPAVRAESRLERGVALALDADFERALLTFDELLAVDTLDRMGLLTLLAERSLTLHALDRGDALRADLRYLAAIEPRFTFGTRAPPQLRERWAEVQAATRPLTLHVEATRNGEGLRVVSLVDGDSATPGLKLRVGHRKGEAEWSLSEGSEVWVEAKAETIEYYVEAVGLGRAVLLSEGTAEAPLRSVAPVALAADPPTSTGERSERGPPIMSRRWLWISVGAGVVVAAAATAIGLGMTRKSGRSLVTADVEF